MAVLLFPAFWSHVCIIHTGRHCYDFHLLFTSLPFVYPTLEKGLKTI